MTSEQVVLILSLLAFGAAVRHGWKHRDYVVLAWAVAFSLTILYYGLLVFHYPDFVENPQLRQSIIRPAQSFSLIGLILHFGNGWINRAITRVLTTLWPSIRKL